MRLPVPFTNWELRIRIYMERRHYVFWPNGKPYRQVLTICPPPAKDPWDEWDRALDKILDRQRGAVLADN